MINSGCKMLMIFTGRWLRRNNLPRNLRIKEIFNCKWNAKNDAFKKFKNHFLKQINIWLANIIFCFYILPGTKNKMKHCNNFIDFKSTPFKHQVVFDFPRRVDSRLFCWQLIDSQGFVFDERCWKLDRLGFELSRTGK